MNRVDIKMMDSKELRKIRQMIREELDFREDVGRDIEKSTSIALDNFDDLNRAIQEAQSEKENEHPHIRERMESMRDWDRKKRDAQLDMEDKFLIQ